jgi:hypothetical protein
VGRIVDPRPGPRPGRVSPWLARSRPDEQATPFTALSVSIAFDGSTFVDVSQLLTPDPVTLRFGRATEFDDITPAVASLALWNDDGDLTPDNPDSPHFPNVTEDKQIQIVVRRGARGWRRFIGWIRSIEPEFPTNYTAGSKVRITAVDDMGLLARFPLITLWATAARFYASVTGDRWDAFRVAGDGASTADFDNITDFPGPKSVATVVAATNQRGTISFGTAEGLALEGSASLAPASNASGAVIRVDLAGPMRALQFWMKLPSEVQTAGGTPQLDLVVFRDAKNANLGSIRLTNNVGQQDIGWFNAAGTFVTQLAFSTAENRWVRVTFQEDSANTTFTDIFYDGGGLIGGGSVNNAGMSMTKVSTIWFGGLGGLVPKVEYSGILVLGARDPLIPAAYGQIAGDVGDQLLSLSWLNTLLPRSIISPFPAAQLAVQVKTGIWHDRNAVEVLQEIMRSSSGIFFARPRDSNMAVVPPDALYPAEPVLTIDAELDLLGAPSLRRAVDTRPTRVTVSHPQGSVTVIDEAAEVAASGQVRGLSTSTVCSRVEDAAAVGQAILERGGLGLRISRLVLDLESAAGQDPVPALFEDTTPLGGLFPTQRLRLLVPASHFGAASKDVHVQGWTEIYDPVAGCRIEADLSPAITEVAAGQASIASHTTVVKTPAAPGTMTIQRPAGVATGDLLLAMHWADNDGSLATMTAPVGFTDRGSFTSSSGFGKVWTKTAGTAEPGSYDFASDTDARTHITLMRVTGADVTNPMLVSPTYASTAAVTSSHVASSVSPAAAGLLVCSWHFVVSPDPVTWTLPGPMTAHGQLVQGASYTQDIVASEQVASGATGTRTATSSISSSALGNARMSLVLRPA